MMHLAVGADRTRFASRHASRYTTRDVRPSRAIALALALLGLPAVARAQEEACSKCHHAGAERPGHKKLVGAHGATAGEALSCTSCHRGVGTARTASVAHAPGAPAEVLGRADAVASCGGCHLPGAVLGTERVVEGARVYLELGCHFCHRAFGFGNAAAFAPPLDAVGLRGQSYLRDVVSKPSKFFPKTKMPAFETFLSHEPKQASALMAFLLSLDGRPRKGPLSFTHQCSACHRPGQKPGAGVEPVLASHRCAWIKTARKDLACGRCHATLPEADGTECLYIDMRRRDCGVCHGGQSGP